MHVISNDSRFISSNNSFNLSGQRILFHILVRRNYPIKPPVYSARHFITFNTKFNRRIPCPISIQILAACASITCFFSKILNLLPGIHLHAPSPHKCALIQTNKLCPRICCGYHMAQNFFIFRSYHNHSPKLLLVQSSIRLSLTGLKRLHPCQRLILLVMHFLVVTL